MDDIIISRLSNQVWKLTNPGGNFSNNGYPTRAPQTTNPTQTALSTGLQAIGDGVIPFGEQIGSIGGQFCPTNLMLIPIGTGSSTTFGMKILGWRPTAINASLGPLPLWVPVTLATYAVTLGTAAGIANSELGTTTLFATTITSTGGPTFITSGAEPVIPDWCQISPGSNAIGCIIQASLGFRYLEVIYTTGGSATDCNALWCRL